MLLLTLLGLASALVGSSSALGQTSTRAGLHPFWERGKAGFLDNAGKVIIQPQFDDALGFSDGLAAVRIGALWGFVNIEGKIVIPPRLQSFGPPPFSNELTSVWVDEPGGRRKAGYIDKLGRLAISPTYRSASSFSEGLAWVCESAACFYIDPAGVNIFGKHFESTGPFREGLASVRLGGKVGFIDKSGNLKISPRYMETGTFSEGFAPVSEDGAKWGFIDKDGAMRIAPVFGKVRDFSEGLAAVEVAGWWGFIDHEGTTVIHPQFGSAGDFHLNMAAVRIGSLFGYVDKRGRLSIKARFTTAGRFCYDGVAFVQLPEMKDGNTAGNKRGPRAYINLRGQFIWKEDIARGR